MSGRLRLLYLQQRFNLLRNKFGHSLSQSLQIGQFRSGAAGECASGVHGKASLPSSSIVVGITFGMIAAEELAKA